jgi:hypothetical protein
MKCPEGGSNEGESRSAWKEEDFRANELLVDDSMHCCALNHADDAWLP